MATREITSCSALDTSPVQNLTAALDCNNSNSNNIARRSLSIFSRRGTATPNPLISRMPSVVFNPTSSVKRQPSRMFRSKKQSALIPEGTILKAVPPATQDARPSPMARSMSTLELEMATSPNEEILSAIRSPSIQASPITPRTPYSATSSLHVLTKKRSQTLRVPMKRSRAAVDAIPEGMIGVWKDGQTQWVQGTSSPTRRSAPAGPTPASATDGTVRPARSGRPQIRVIIPSHRLNAPLPSLPFFATSSQSNRSPSMSTSSTLVASESQEPHPPRQSSLQPSARQTVQPHQTHRPRRSTSSSDSSSNADDEDNSNYSRSSRSSITSVESETANNQYQLNLKRLRERTGSQAFSIVTPAAAGVFDDASVITGSPRPRSPSIAELPGSPPSDKCTVSRASSRTSPLRRQSTKRMSSRRGTWLLSAPPRRSRDATRPESMSLSDAETELENTLTSIENGGLSSTPATATLTIGIAELAAEPVPQSPPPIPAKSQRRLTVAYRQTKGAAVVPALELPKAAYAVAGRAKTLRERRRESKSQEKRPEYSTRSYSMPEVEKLSLAELPEIAEDAWQEERAAAQREITAYQAECVIKRIMESLSTLNDLHNTAILNKGFYGVYKRNEMNLLWAVLKNASPAAWEFMQATQSSPILEHEEKVVVDAVAFTPSSFMTALTKSQLVVESLKKLMHSTCRSFLRPSTFGGLVDSTSPASVRIDAALWRIWTFCCIFGSNKGREDDMLGQKDWINGGAMAHQQSCTSTIVSSDSFAMSEVLLNASEHFGRGNGVDGLNAEEIYDMTELWNCMKWLIEGLEGQTEQARQHGVFDHTDVRGGDIDGEEAMLEEYTSYLLTLGLEPVLIIASALHPDHEATLDQLVTSARPFALAKNNGWMGWTVPPPGASRCNFLKESLTRMYEERIQCQLSDSERQAAAAKKEEIKEVRRQRGQSYAQEIMRSRQSLENEPKPQLLRPLGLVDERPMSDWELVLTKLAKGEAASQQSSSDSARDHSQRSASPDQSEKQSIEFDTPALPEAVVTPPQSSYNKEYGSSPSSCSASPRMRHSRPGSSPSGRSISPVSPSTSLSDIHPAFRSEVAASRAKARSDISCSSSAISSSPKPRHTVTFAPHPLQLKLASDLEDDLAMDTAGRAIARIMEMGFTSAQASHALMKTDLGDGLNVDSAVEYLLQT